MKRTKPFPINGGRHTTMFSSPYPSCLSSSLSSSDCYSNSFTTSPAASCLALRPRAHHRRLLVAPKQCPLPQPLPSSFTTFTTSHSPSFLSHSRLSNIRAKDTESDVRVESPSSSSSSPSQVDCIGTGLDAECYVPLVPGPDESSEASDSVDGAVAGDSPSVLPSLVGDLLELGLLISPFFFWGTGMVTMKLVLPKTGPFFAACFRLIPAGLLLIAYAASRGRKFPSGFNAWISITLFALIDGACFQGFLAEGLQSTNAGLGSVIIDSQPLTVAVLASYFFGESIGLVGASGLVLGVLGLLLLEVPALHLDGHDFSLWGSGEFWMLLAAQSMAVGTVMVRWVSKYSDPIMATGWHMVIGGLPLVAISIRNHDPAFSAGLKELSASDFSALLYSSVFGTGISFGVFFYNATRGSLTKLSSLTFLTPMFASIFGFLFLNETFSPVQMVGALVTLVGIYLVNYKSNEQ